jgi:RNA polymerase sigma factor (sigma-70 family)
LDGGGSDVRTHRDLSGQRLLETLFHAGTAAGRTDGQLLEWFVTGDREASELAFATLLERHGAMVLRTCRAVLRDEHEAQDAFQATFLILVRHGRALWVRDSLGPWLFRVARRAAGRARRAALRRMSAERTWMGTWVHARPANAAGVTEDVELASLLHEEVDRLPNRYRAAVVLCDIEGRTYEDAARHLACPVGTLKSRLARGRTRLRDRLTRRGVAPACVLPPDALTLAAHATVPSALSDATIRAAIRFATTSAIGAGSVPTAVAALSEGVLKSMMFASLKWATLIPLVLLVAVGGLAAGTSLFQQPAPLPEQAAAPRAQAQAPSPINRPAKRAWQLTANYEPPDFDLFFPDDAEGGKALDALWNDELKDKRPVDEILGTVRRGLRRTEAPRDQIISWIGGSFIWNAPRQDPDAVEILYHAADFRSASAAADVTRYNAVYYGLSVVQPKTPAVLRTLGDMCMIQKADWGRVAWGARAQRDELLREMKPYLAAALPATREQAAVLVKVLGGEPDANDAVLAWTRKTIRAKVGDRLPAIRQALATGDKRQRLEALDEILRERIGLIMDDSYVDAFAACAKDKDPAVRKQVCRTLGQAVWGFEGARKPDAIGVILELSEDDDFDVRYQAVYFGLSQVPQERRDDVLRRLLAMAMTERNSPRGRSLYARIVWGVGRDRSSAAQILDEYLRGTDANRARAAREIYKDMTGRTPPGNAADQVTRASYATAFRDLHEHIRAVYPNFRLKGIDWDAAGRELQPRAAAAQNDEQFGLLVLELVAKLEDSHAVVLEGSTTPPDPGMPQWDPFLACTSDDRGRPVVYVVGRATPAWKAGVRPGMTVVAVNGVPADKAIEEWMKQQRKYFGYSSERYLRYDATRLFHRQKKEGMHVKLELENVDGRRSVADLAASYHGWYIPRLPVERPEIDDGGADVSWTRLQKGIGYIQVRRIRQGLEAALDRALTSLGSLQGLVLDVRGNSGGGFDVATAFVNFEPVSGAGGARNAQSKRPRYTGRIALLIDERCISAGEGWASWFIARKRARVFGTATAGASARKEMYTLQNGLYKVQIPVKAYNGFLDRPIERRGLEPDEEVRCSAKDLAAGNDTVVEAAISWLTATPRP